MKSSSQAKFITTAMAEKDYPVLRDLSGSPMPEIAVAGRSNVGKSSLLNHFFHAKHLVKTSSEPGKTQAINFFSFRDEWVFVDLPGYGYASVSQSIKKNWGPMMKTYFEKRETLKLILLLLDIRRIPNEEDMQFVEWASYHNKALIVVLTKVDKLNQNEKKINTQIILNKLNAQNIHYVHYSVPKNIGRKELAYMVKDALADEALQDAEQLVNLGYKQHNNVKKEVL
jgi:GTP-binding protein